MTTRTARRKLVFGYLRLSKEEALRGESSSISTQRQMIANFCEQNGFTLIKTFSDDGWSGGNFDRPGFRAMIEELSQGKANTVITKDLSRLGRNMRDASYYAEEYFPENNIHFFTLSDHFDTEQENIMAPFQFALNEVYLRDGSRKVKEALKIRRNSGQYCACPPYGYRKDEHQKNHLVPDETTGPVVQRIFAQAAKGDSSRKIAMDLNEDGVIPPLKYRVLYRDEFCDRGAARMSDTWNQTTVKRILKNRVYLGHTILGKSKKVSVKSHKKVPVPKDKWAVTENTHEALVSEEVYDKAQKFLGTASRDYRAYDHVRKSIFSGVAVCGRCGHALCSCGTVYKGKRDEYWFLSCTHQRQDIVNRCDGVRIRYADLLELVRRELNELIALSDEQRQGIVDALMAQETSDETINGRKRRLDQAQARQITIDRMIGKLYMDNANGDLSDDRLHRMVGELETESQQLDELIAELELPVEAERIQKNYDQFFRLVQQYTSIEELDRETLTTFVERIEVGPKIIPEGKRKVTHRNQPFQQKVKIFYKFIGELNQKSVRNFPQVQQDQKPEPQQAVSM